MIKKSFRTFLYLMGIFLILFQYANATNIVRLSPEYFPNSSIGRALSSADIYVGKPDLDPEIVANQKQLSVQQENGTIVNVSQPISTGAGGVPLYNGSPVTLLVEGDYSLKVNDSSGSQIYYVPSVASQSLVPGNFYYPDYTNTDQGIAGNGSSVFDIITAVGSSTNATMYFAHNSGSATTTYTFTTNEIVTDNFNIIIEKGAILDGAGTLTVNESFNMGLYRVFGPSITVVGLAFAHPEWWYSTGSYHTAINSAILANEDVELSNKIYTITSPITPITNSNFYGIGPASIITNTTAASDVIQINGTVGTPLHNVKIHDLKITSTADVGSNGINADYSNNLQVYNCHFDTMDKGVDLDDSNNAVIKNNYMTDVKTGVDLADSDYCKTVNNHIVDGHSTWPGVGSGIVYTTCENGVIDGNTVYNVGGDGIVLNANSLDCVVSNNNISTCGRYGMIVDDGSTGSRITGNKIDTTTNTGMAVVEDEHVIVGNEIRDCSVTAMTIEDSSYCTVVGNRITDCGTTTSHHGIANIGTINGVHYNTISGNIIEGVTGESIHIDGSTGGAVGNVITGNVIDTPYRGITINTTTKTKLTDNTIGGAGIAGNRISVESSDDIKGDVTIMSTVIDLSGGADAGYFYYPRQQGIVISLAIYFTEATSADAGVRLRIGSTSSSAKYLDIPAGAGSTLVSQTVDTDITWHVGEDAEAILNSGVLLADDYIRWWNDGGKVGTGEIIIILEICLHG